MSKPQPQLNDFERLLLTRLTATKDAERPAKRQHDGLILEVPVSCLALACLERLVERDGITVDQFATNAVVDAVERLPAVVATEQA